MITYAHDVQCTLILLSFPFPSSSREFITSNEVRNPPALDDLKAKLVLEQEKIRESLEKHLEELR